MAYKLQWITSHGWEDAPNFINEDKEEYIRYQSEEQAKKGIKSFVKNHNQLYSVEEEDRYIMEDEVRFVSIRTSPRRMEFTTQLISQSIPETLYEGTITDWYRIPNEIGYINELPSYNLTYNIPSF